MQISTLASETGFVTAQSKADDKEEVYIDSFLFPKHLPEPVFQNGQEIYASDQAEESKMVKAILPSYHTPMHCIVYPSNSIPPKNDRIEELKKDPGSYDSILKSLKGQAEIDKQNRQHYLSSGNDEDVIKSTKDVIESIKQIIQLQLYKAKKNEEGLYDRLFVLEINSLVDKMDDLSNAYEKEGNDDIKNIDDDIETILSQLERYNDDPNSVNKELLLSIYYEMKEKYEWLYCK